MTSAEKAYKYNSTTVGAITSAIMVGASRDDAALAAGIDRSTFYRWMGEIPEFVEQVEKAEAARIVQWLRIIEANALEHWQAAAWKLERLYPKKYGKKVAMQVVDSEGNAIDPAEVRRKFAARIATILESETEIEDSSDT